MKISLKSLIIVAFASLSIVACKKKETPAPNPGDGDRLVGSWNIEQVINVEYENGSVVERDTLRNPGTITFNANGTGLTTLSFMGLTFTDTILEWSRTTPTQVRMRVKSTMTQEIETTFQDVITDEATFQRWFSADPTKSDPDRTEATISMRKR